MVTNTTGNHFFDGLAGVLPRDDIVLKEVFRVLHNVTWNKGIRTALLSLGRGQLK